jgi:hypothetical protein
MTPPFHPFRQAGDAGLRFTERSPTLLQIFKILATQQVRMRGKGWKPLPLPLARIAGDCWGLVPCQDMPASFDSISVQANGDIVCWCVDVQGQRVYGNVHTDRIASKSIARASQTRLARLAIATALPSVNSAIVLY